MDAWSSFQAQLAATYDNSPMIRGISNTAGAAATDEPFVPLHPDQVGDLESGGYSDAAEAADAAQRDRRLHRAGRPRRSTTR